MRQEPLGPANSDGAAIMGGFVYALELAKPLAHTRGLGEAVAFDDGFDVRG